MMLDFLMCALANLFRMYIIYRFIKVFFCESDTHKVRELAAYLFFYVSNTALYWIFHKAWINLLCNLVCMIMIVGLHTKQIKKIVFVTSTVYLVNMVCDIATTILFVNYKDGEVHSQIYAVISVLFIFICELVMERIVTSVRQTETEHGLSLIVVPILSIFVMWILLYTDACNNTGIAILSMGFLIINFVMLYIYNLLIASLSQKYETELLKKQVSIYSNQLNMIKQSEDRVKALRHDMKHHINEIKLLSVKNRASEIHNYIAEMEKFLDEKNDMVSSGNMEMDSVLNYMLQYAGDMLNVVETKIVIPEKLKHTFDINVVLTNILENAIEASMLTEEKYLSVNILFDRGLLKINVENTFISDEMDKLGGRTDIPEGFTTKKDKQEHGIGLRNVRRIIESYNGVMDTKIKNNIYSVSIVLYMNM